MRGIKAIADKHVSELRAVQGGYVIGVLASSNAVESLISTKEIK
jgi:hypothetical protein